MSAAFKNAKRKVTQSELRRFMSEQKNKLQKNVKKIESPLANYTYNENGQLMCVLCNSIVRSEAVWTVHINAKQHKDNVNLAKKLKEKTNNFTVPVKRPLSPLIEDVSSKKVKGILKNSSSNSAVPADFFDSKQTETVKENVKTSGTEEEPMEAEDIANRANQAKIPEGFFDDPVMDAKARNQEYKDPVEEEWEKFQRELKEVDLESAAIIAEDQEEATTERQIDEIDEQLRNWSRVIDLERKKEALAAATKEQEAKENEDDSSSEEIEFNEFLDWRSKNSFK